MKLFLSTAVLLVTVLSTGDAVASRKRILFLTALSFRSENEMFYPLINELEARGHEITVVTSDPASPSKIRSKNVTQILPFSYSALMEGYDKSAFDPYRPMDWVFFDVTPFLKFCNRVFENEEFKEKVLKRKFDMVVVNVLLNQCFYGLAYKDQASLVLLQTFPMSNTMLGELGSYAPTSIVPFYLSSFGYDMNLLERTMNFLADWVFLAFNELVNIPPAEAVYRKYLGQHLPGIREIHRNTSLVLLNTNPLATPMRPMMPDIVEVGGLHCRAPKPLRKDIEDFVAGAEHGFIYFSLGTVASSNEMPKDIQDKLMHVFNKLKQRVLWKSGSETQGVIRSNVYLKNFFPQQDLLGHKNIRLYISHGGLFGTLESIYHGVPVLGMPLYFDQMANVQNAVSKGYALQADLRNIDEKSLEDSINKLIEDQRFKKRAKEMSEFFKDELKNPVERAVFNIERVLKHRNMLEFRTTNARKFNFLQFHSLDVIGFLFLVALALLLISKTLITFTFLKIKQCFMDSSKARLYKNKKTK